MNTVRGNFAVSVGGASCDAVEKYMLLRVFLLCVDFRFDVRSVRVGWKSVVAAAFDYFFIGCLLNAWKRIYNCEDKR